MVLSTIYVKCISKFALNIYILAWSKNLLFIKDRTGVMIIWLFVFSFLFLTNNQEYRNSYYDLHNDSVTLLLRLAIFHRHYSNEAYYALVTVVDCLLVISIILLY